MGNKLIKSKQRVKDFAEVYTPEWLINNMLDTIPKSVYENIESTFLEPSCGNGNFLAVILKRKFARCKDIADGLKSLNSIFGVEIQQDNVEECRERLLDMFKRHFPNANELAVNVAKKFLKTHIICDDFLNPKTEMVKAWAKTGQLSLFD